MKEINENDFVTNKSHISMTPGEMLAALRKLLMLTQKELAEKAGMTQANISSMESGRQQIGRERAMTLARVFNVHPTIIMFPDFKTEDRATPQYNWPNPKRAIDSGNSPLLRWNPSSLNSRGLITLSTNALVSTARSKKAITSVNWKE